MFASRSRATLPLILSAIASLCTLVGCGSSNSTATPAGSNQYVRTNLVSDKASFSDAAGKAAVTEPNLVNPWGIALSPTSPFWIADNGASKATIYDGTGAIQGLVVNMASPTGTNNGAPSGQIYNNTADFATPAGAASLFLFSTEDGTILA